ncbi:CbiX/SirB N-terminal domain-containing protein [Bradyrhizobium sp.]|uniref:CbiX/SirB N-terminal domain-containing protein n=1 Tax=Bradyrhizobium sp. TaxID=376 RepID=UPI003C743EB9
MSADNNASQMALLIAAHGERRLGARNAGVWRIAQAVAAQNPVSEVGVGFISGAPTIGEAFATLTAPRVIVYPLFASSGYFTRDRLVQLLDEANNEGRSVEVLPPLGLDPGLSDFVVAHAAGAARRSGFAPRASTVILLAHGSRRNSASREATERIAREIRHRAEFRDVHIALLEERPFLRDAAALAPGSAIVVGLFSGEGMHGANDAPRLIAELDRNDIVFAGVIGSFPGVEELISTAVTKALRGTPVLVPD